MKDPAGGGRGLVMYELPPDIFLNPPHSNTTTKLDKLKNQVGFVGTINKWWFEVTIMNTEDLNISL